MSKSPIRRASRRRAEWDFSTRRNVFSALATGYPGARLLREQGVEAWFRGRKCYFVLVPWVWPLPQVAATYAALATTKPADRLIAPAFVR
ncbi:MAG TPA: hypothetical protein VMF65_22860 [Acidimicrobiales bacterium]|nr:hypothetical protein [Acidimicrobiales bacterium]